GSDGSLAVATVDGHDITQAEWDAQQRRSLDQARQRNPALDAKTFDTPEAKRSALDAIVRDRVQQAAQAHESLAASDERVRQELQKSPEFEQLRQMPPAERTLTLAQQGLTPEAFFEYVRNGLSAGQATQGVQTSAIVPVVTSQAGVEAYFGKREIQWQHFDPKDYAAAAQPTDAQVQAYYADKSHAAEFTAPEEAKIEYVVLDVDALKSQVTPAQADVQKYYDAHAAQFTAPEERHVSHILVNVDPKASQADKDKAKARAEQILAEVKKNPSSFAEVAKKESDDGGTKESGGDLDWVRKDTFKGALGSTIFSMKPGEIAGPVQSDVGYHVVELTGVRGGTAKPLAEVQNRILDQLRTDAAQKKYASVSEQFSNTVYEQPDSLDPIVKALGLQKQTATVHRKPASDAVGPLASAKLLDAVFAPDTLTGKHNTEAVETSRDQLVSARVLAHQPARLRPLAEVHDQVVATLRNSQAAAAARKEGEAKLAAVRKDPAMALPLTATVGRAALQPEIPPDVVVATSKADIGKGPAIAGVTLDDGGYAVVRVVKAVPPSAEEIAAQQQQRDAVARAYGDAVGAATYESLKTRYKAKIDEAHVAQAAEAADAAASSPSAPQ
ncbi:MAG TPA: peptidylprolyl isomerase, partial [Burkholderiaceae bacterium]|nr:peptidylprolyl isomerase [Burkholderiaceae bacterium]